MKRFLALSGIALLIASCQISIGTPETTDNISGYYSLTSALWSSPVDISGHGDASEDLRHQLLMYGWWGTMTQTGLSEEKSALDASVLLPLPSDGLGQINLFIPFFYYDGDGATELPQPPTPHEGRCCVVMTRTTFNYEYDENNNINVILSGVPSEGETFPMKYHTLDVNPGGEMVFHASTTLYDFATSSWVDGVLTLRYRRCN